MLLLYLVTASSHILYYYIWNNPEDFIDFTYSYNIKPVIFMSRICYLQKCLQWYLILLNSYDNESLFEFIDNFNIINVVLIGSGQLLNLSVYNALGTKGVYYGNLFESELPYITSFPYNLGIQNPQYVGCILTLFGLYPMVSIPYIFYGMFLYIFTIYAEV
jgi:hypothetical protein